MRPSKRDAKGSWRKTNLALDMGEECHDVARGDTVV